MVVGAPDIDQVIESAAEFLGHISDIGREVGRAAVRTDDDAVLVVAEGRRAEPQRAVLFEEMTGGPQTPDRPLHPPIGMEGGLGRPDIEVDAETLQAGLDRGSHPECRPVADDLVRIGPGRGRLSKDLVGKVPRELTDVQAVITIVGDRLAMSKSDDGRPEVRDLAATVVEVVLARDALPARLQDPAQQVADERAARIADGERAGRVGRHEFDVHGSWADGRHRPPRIRFREDAIDDRGEGVGPDSDVEKTRGRNLGGFDR